MPNITRKFLPEIIEQWGKLCRLKGGDMIHVHDIVSNRMDSQDVSFICVCELIVKHSWKITHFYILPNSMSNLLIETSNIETVPKFSS